MVTSGWEIRSGLWQSFVQTAASVKSTSCTIAYLPPKVIEQILLRLTQVYFFLEPLRVIKPFLKYSEKQSSIFLSFLNILKIECNKSLISLCQEYYSKSSAKLLFTFNSSLLCRIYIHQNLNRNNFTRIVDKERRKLGQDCMINMTFQAKLLPFSGCKPVS